MNLHNAWEGAAGRLPALTSTSAGSRDLDHWRTERRIRTAYDPSRYELPALQWTQSSFMQPQMMVQDRYFYDPVAGRYTVDRYLDDLDKRYGGIDAVLIWATYPNMGIDDRNQLDMVESMPGGVEGVRQMVADFHRRGVRVLFPMMMWDEGTHQPDQPWPQAIAALMKQSNTSLCSRLAPVRIARLRSLGRARKGLFLAAELLIQQTQRPEVGERLLGSLFVNL